MLLVSENCSGAYIMKSRTNNSSENGNYCVEVEDGKVVEVEELESPGARSPNVVQQYT